MSYGTLLNSLTNNLQWRNTVITSYEPNDLLFCKNQNNVLHDESKRILFPILSKNCIKKVIFNEPATIVYWEDGTKTVVKCQPCDIYSKETGLALCIVKKVFGNNNVFNDVMNKFLEDK